MEDRFKECEWYKTIETVVFYGKPGPEGDILKVTGIETEEQYKQCRIDHGMENAKRDWSSVLIQWSDPII